MSIVLPAATCLLVRQALFCLVEFDEAGRGSNFQTDVLVESLFLRCDESGQIFLLLRVKPIFLGGFYFSASCGK